MTLSIVAHGLALAGWLWVQQVRQGPSSIGQKRGSLSVRLLTPAPPVPAKPMVLPPVKVQPHRHAEAAERADRATAIPSRSLITQPRSDAVVMTGAPSEPPTQVETLPPPSSASQPQATPAQAAPPNPVAEPPGARFASLFAPIVSRPLGRGRWSTPAPAPVMPSPAQMATMQREQAIQGVRHALGQRIERMKAQLRDAPLAQTCDIAISLERQSGQINCQQPQDLQWVSTQLNDLLNLLPTTVAMDSGQCLQAVSSELTWVTCPVPRSDP